MPANKLAIKVFWFHSFPRGRPTLVHVDFPGLKHSKFIAHSFSSASGSSGVWSHEDPQTIQMNQVICNALQSHTLPGDLVT